MDKREFESGEAQIFFSHLRIKEHQANCRNQNQHSAVVDHSATWCIPKVMRLVSQKFEIKFFN